MTQKANIFLLFIGLFSIWCSSPCYAQQSSTWTGMIEDYQLLVGLKSSSVNYSIDPIKDRKGGSYIPCAEVQMGELCGNYAQSGNYGHSPDSEPGYDWTIGVTGPYSFFGDSNFGYQIVFDGQLIQFESEEQGYSNSGLPSELGGEDGSPGREKQLEQNQDANIRGYFVGVTPVFFVAPLRGQNYLLKLGLGIGLGYVDISGEVSDGYIRTRENLTNSNQDYLNQKNYYKFAYAGSVYTLKFDVELAFYSIRLSYGGNFWFVPQADSMAKPRYNEGPVLTLSYAYPLF